MRRTPSELQEAIGMAVHQRDWHALMADTFPAGSHCWREHQRQAKRHDRAANGLATELAVAEESTPINDNQSCMAGSWHVA